jgi:fatty-acyl-CoA synthase
MSVEVEEFQGEEMQANDPHWGGTLGGILVDALGRFKHRPAIADDRIQWSYGELANVIGRFIAVYKSIGLKKGDALSILSANRAESWAAICAAMIMGVRYTPLHPMASEDDHLFIIEDAEIDLLIVDAARFEARGRAISSRARGLRHTLSFGSMENATDILVEIESAKASPLIDESDFGAIAWLAYTGGTSGRPKGVMLSHRTFVMMSLLLMSDWDWPTHIRFAAVTPISHAAGVTLFPIMCRGGFMRLMDGFESDAFCRVVEQHKINATFLVPTIIYALLDDSAVRSRYDLSSLETIVYGAAPMSPHRIEQGVKVFGPVFVQMYGQTESPQCIMTLRKEDHDLSKPHRLGSCGRPAPSVTVKLFDEKMREADVGQPGEICVRGPLVMDGYWKRDDATEEAFRHGWLHTGDVATKDEEGYFYLVDRTKDLIITGGFNVYPREVEDAIAEHPAVAHAAVIGIPDSKWGEAVKAFIVLKAGCSVGAAEIQAHVKNRRGGPWSPKSIDFVEAIPVTSLGKIDRKALRSPYWSGRDRGIA